MRRDDAVYLRHILDAIVLIDQYMSGLDEAAFSANTLVRDAVVRQLEIIGEATKHVSSTLRAQNPDVPWQIAAAMRDKLIHDYMGVESSIVWQTVRESLPPFKNQVQAVLDAIQGNL